jgi:glycosyltransferase involved in cell wall biosynthesis
MKIAMTGNVFPMGRHLAYSGERMIFYLIEQLAKMGHEVYVFAREGSDFTNVPIKDYVPTAALDSKVDVHYEAVKKYLGEHPNLNFDVYFCGYFGDGWNPECQFAFPGYVEFPWCRWSHGTFQNINPSFNIISCSKVLQQDFFQSGVPSTLIHYGIPEDLYKFSSEHDNYAVWLGKIEGGKAPHLAIKLALSAGLKMVVMGPPYNTGCFWQQVAPYIDNKTVFWVRGVNDEQKYKIMSRAKVFISANDNTWKEHFGITNIEALAMGVPIIGFNRIDQDCAIKTDQIIEDGIHGFLLNYKDSNDVEEILEKGWPLMKQIGQISREACREQFMKKFTAKLMGERYEWFFNKIVYEGVRIGKIDIPF